MNSSTRRQGIWTGSKRRLAVLAIVALLSLTGVSVALAESGNACRIDTVEYATLDAAVADANSSTSDVTIEMLGDATVSSGLSISNTHGKTITLTSADTASPNTLTFGADGFFAVSSDFNCAGISLEGSGVTRTQAAIQITDGTTTMGNNTLSCNISNFGNQDSICAGAVFNVSQAEGATAVLNMKSGDISYCSVGAGSDEAAQVGGSVLYLNGGTVNYGGMYTYYCRLGGQTRASLYESVICVYKGTFNMTAGSINNNTGGYGGAVSLRTANAAANISGGTITSNQAACDGGAIYAQSGSTVSISGSAWLNDNVTAYGGSAIAYRSGAKVSIEGSPMITGNRADQQSASTPAAAICGDDSAGAVTISGSPTIARNTIGYSEDAPKADVQVYSASTLLVGDMTDDASVGVCSPTAGMLVQGAQFATASGTASATTNLTAFFNDSNPVDNLVLAGVDGSDPADKAVVWGNPPYTCKIVDGTTVTPFMTLKSAIASVPTEGNASIEMLVESYDISTEQTIWTEDRTKSITITTAAETTTDGYPYRGTSGTTSTLNRTHDCTALSVSPGCTLTLTNITLSDASSSARSYSKNLIRVVGDASIGSATVNLGEGAAVTGGNNGTDVGSSRGAGVYLLNATLNMADDAMISGCQGAEGSAVYGQGCTVNMRGSSQITGCATGNKGAVSIGSDGLANKSVLNMFDTSKIGANTTTSGGASAASAVYLFSRGDNAISELNMAGTAEASGNTTTAGTGGAAAINADNGAAAVALSGSASIKNNTTTSASANSAGGIVLASGCTLNLAGSAAITGNKTGYGQAADTSSAAGGVNALSGSTVTLSGSANVKGNTCKNGTQDADLTLPDSADTLVVGEDGLAANAAVGIYSVGGEDDAILQNGAQFATTAAAYATKVANLDTLFSNVAGQSRTGTAGVGNKVVWGSSQLTVGNAVSGTGADASKQFSFTLTGLQNDGDTPTAYTGSVYKASAPDTVVRTYTLSADATSFALAGDEYITVSGIPVGSPLAVSETDDDASTGTLSAYKGSIANGSPSATTFTIADLSATAPGTGLAVGSSSLLFANARNSVGLSAEDAQKTSVYGSAGDKAFSVTGVDNVYEAVWCNSDGTTTGAPKSAGTFASGAVSGGQSTLTMALAANAAVGTYYFKVVDGDATSNVLAYTVTPAIISVTGDGTVAVSKVYDGTTGAGDLTGALAFSGKVGDEGVDVAAAAGQYADANAGTGKSVDLALTLTGTAKGNYALASSTYTFTGAAITRASISVGVTLAGWTYGEAAPSPALTEGSNPGEGKVSYTYYIDSSLTTKTTTANSGAAAEGERPVNAGTWYVKASVAESQNYEAGDGSTSFSIAQKAVTITGLGAEDKVYDGTASATPTGTAVLDGAVLGDDVYAKAGTAAFADAGVGADKEVSFSGYTLEGTDAGNYYLAAQPAGVTASIAAKGITITGLGAENKVYDGTTPAAITGTAVLSGVVDGDKVSLNADLTAAAFADAGAGADKTVTFSGYKLEGEDAGSYALTQPTATADITAKTIGIGWSEDTLVYNGMEQCPTATATGLVGTDTCSITVTGGQKNAGTGYTATAASVDNANYQLPSSGRTTEYAISPAIISVTGDGTVAVSKVYDGTTGAGAFTGALAFSGKVGDESVDVAAAAGQYADANAGTGKSVDLALTLTGTARDNYALASSTYTFKGAAITRADATDAMKTATDTVSAGGETGKSVAIPAVPEGGVAGTAAASGDIVISVMSVENDILTYTAAESTAGSVATVSIPVTGAVNYKDYVITVTITSKPKTEVVISGVSVADKTYDAAPAAASGTAVCKAGGVEVTGGCGELVYTWSGTGQTSYGPASTPPVNAGTYQLVVSVASGNIRYMGTSAPIAFTIAAKDVSITGLGAEGKTYDGTDAAAVTGTTVLSGVLDGDSVSVKAGSAAFLDADAGEGKTVSFSGYTLEGEDAGNYRLTAQPADVKASIGAASITATPDSGQFKAVNQDDPALSWKAVGAVDGETPAYSGALSREQGEEVGTYAILPGSLTLADNAAGNFKAANYTLAIIRDILFEIKDVVPPTIVTTNLNNAVVGAEYAEQIVAAGDGTFIYSIEAGGGTLPEGLTLDGATGAITGTPDAAGTSRFTVVVTSEYGTDSQDLSIVVGSEPVATHTVNASVNDATMGSITPEGDIKVDEGKDRSFVVRAADGYVLDHLLIDGVQVVAQDVYTFSDVAAGHTIKAVFAEHIVLEGIAISTPPDKTNYTEGDRFEAAGMVVTATYSNGSSHEVAGYTINPDRALEQTDTAVTISYVENGVTKTVAQAINVKGKPTLETIITGGTLGDPGKPLTQGVDYTNTIVAGEGKALPASIAITAGGVTLTVGTDYLYNSETGEFTIYGAAVKGHIIITATCPDKEGPSPAVDPTPTSSKASVTPNTGDTANVFALIGMGILCIAGFAAVAGGFNRLRYRSRTNKRR